MSKRQFKSQASSSRAATGAGFGGFGSTSASSTLSYLTEPPNLSSVSDANVVVAFKNLSKKDGTTKSKALEDLRAYVQAHPYEQDGGVEEAVLEAWVKFYPRLSIDNSRRVRELSHILQIDLLKSARKRMEKYIPKVVGSWLGGTYDRDRAVARTAKDGIKAFLNTEAKFALFYKRCESQILEYAQEALEETSETLSDERTMSKDDMQGKYFRVIGSSISLVINLLQHLDKEDLSKHQERYVEFLSGNKKLWSFSFCDDSFVRRATDELLSTVLTLQPAAIESDLELISHTFISEALKSSQTTSAFQLLTVLVKLTARYPEVWTTSYKAKRSPFLRLRSFVEKGSQGGPPEYWTNLGLLFTKLSKDVIPLDVDVLLDFLKAFRNGASRREEPRSNATVAWATYFNIVKLFAARIPEETQKDKLLSTGLFPVFEQFLQPTTDGAAWAVGNNTSTIANALVLCSAHQSGDKTALNDEVARLEKDFISKILTSLPEQSKEYHTSQKNVMTIGHRWFKLLGDVVQLKDQYSVDLLTSSSQRIIATCLETLVTRNGKPYCAAGTVEAALRFAPSTVMSWSGSQAAITSFLETHFPKLILSPSGPYLIQILSHLRTIPGQEASFEAIWTSTIDGLLALPVDVNQPQAIGSLIANDSISQLAKDNAALQEYLLHGSLQATQGDTTGSSLFEAAIRFQSLASRTSAKLINHILSFLEGSGPAVEGSLKCLEFIAKNSPDLLSGQSDVQVRLITKLLALTEISNSPFASRANAVRSILEKSSASRDSKMPQKSSILHVIKENLESASAQSLAIETLIQQATNLIGKDLGTNLVDLFPNTQLWSEALFPLLGHSQTPNPALGVMRPFAGAVFLVSDTAARKNPRPARDINGHSIPLRMAMYTSTLLLREDVEGTLPQELQVELLYLLSLCSELANDQLDLLEDNKLFGLHEDTESVTEVRVFIQNVQGILGNAAIDAESWRENGVSKENSDKSTAAVVHNLVSRLIESSNADSPTAYYAAKSLARLLQALVSAQGWQSEGGEEWLASLDILKTSSNNILGATAILIGLEDSLRTSKFVNNFCNRLVSDIAGTKADSGKVLDMLVLLNATLAIYDEGDLPVANNRLVFAIKQILSWTEELGRSDHKIAAEACRALQKLLPAIKDVYGQYWETTLDYCVSIWNSCQDALTNEKLPMVGMSLKLYSILQSMSTAEDANDDLQDALNLTEEQVSAGLVHLLKLERSKENQPLEFVDSVLSRLVVKIPSDRIRDLSEFYPLVTSDFKAVQSAAFDVLHKALPKVQQELSVNVLLEGTTAQLPLELLSLLLNTPSADDISESSDFPAPIRGYLLSWLIVFESYKTASLKVRNDYSELLKTENYLSPLLNFMFIMLGHSDANALNLERAHIDNFMIRHYDIWAATDSSSAEQSLNWLLIHLYYLCLNYTPGLVRTWWFSCDSRQTTLAVDSWTRKYFTPLVIEDSLDEVEKWATNQETPAEDEKELIIKVSKRSKEIFAGYEVDELMMQIVIRFPDNYPLEGVKVEGLNRVAVSEKKWATWLRNTQGVITFSNGSIIDGLTAFQRNVTGALKGHTECAICYSIIGPDKKTPDKRCQTCNNLFHSNCLYKWFSSSNQSTCPLCRNPFNYGVGGRR